MTNLQIFTESSINKGKSQKESKLTENNISTVTEFLSGIQENLTPEFKGVINLSTCQSMLSSTPAELTK